MKNLKLLLTILILAAAAGVLLTCEGIIALGTSIDLLGPIVNIKSPPSRTPISGKFIMTGDVKEKGNSPNSAIDRVLIKAQYSKEEPSTGNFQDVIFEIRWQYTFSSDKWEACYYKIDWKDNALTGTKEPDYVEVHPWTELEDVMINGESITAEWNGNNRGADWLIPIDMELFGHTLRDGQYIFSVTAWDMVGNSDDNSYKTVMVIISNTLPEVNIILPDTYDPTTDIDPSDLAKWNELNAILDTDIAARRNPANIGRFITGEFPLQFQIDSQSDVWAIDIRFYDITKTTWANGFETDDYIYKLHINNPGDLHELSIDYILDNTLNPFYRVTIPDLTDRDNAPDIIPGTNINQHLANPVTKKTSMRIVVRCMDITGNLIHEDQMDKGLFVYWPDANIPWVQFPGGMKDTYSIGEKLYTMYPNSKMPIKAYDNNGVDRVIYSVDEVYYDTDIGVYIDKPVEGFQNLIQYGYEEGETRRSRIITWDFSPPVVSAVYKITATVYDTNNPVKSDTFTGYFTVTDVSYPEIDPPYTPVSREPLFNFIKGNTIDDWYIEIFGYAYDNMGIEDVRMAWINPHSPNYAAMSQLAYFRDSAYIGWTKAASKGQTPVNTPCPHANVNVCNCVGLDITYDKLHPNKVWTLTLSEPGMDYDTQRQKYEYSVKLNLKNDLNIAPGVIKTLGDPDAYPPIANILYDYLKSQVFVFKATKSDAEKKATIITWSPQGDTNAPEIQINKGGAANASGVSISRTANVWEQLEKGVYTTPIEQIQEGNRIRIQGTWREDSSDALPVNTVLKPFLEVTINKIRVPTNSITISPATEKAASGTWTAEIVVGPGSGITSGYLKDALVIGAKLIDIGGNPSEDSASWLVQSDDLRFLRVGSDTSDGTYTYFNAGGNQLIDIFLEFNKPVKLASTTLAPALLLNVTGGSTVTAVYNASHPDNNRNPQGTSTKQHFTYTVQNGHSSPDLTVTGIQGGDTNYNTANYNFTWVTVAGSGTVEEEIRMVTRDPGTLTPLGQNKLLGQLPTRTSPNAGDTSGGNYTQTLMAGKEIIIDTTPPLIAITNGITRSPNDGYYNRGDNSAPNTIYISLNFNESVKIDESNKPQLVLNIRNGANATRTTDNVQLNNTKLVFSYEIKAGDYSGNALNSYSAVQITGVQGGDITDLAGNKFVQSVNTTFTGLFVDNIAPLAPTMEIRSAANGSAIASSSGTPTSSLGSVYYNNLFLRITSNPSSTAPGIDMERIEYSNDNGGNWTIYSAQTELNVLGEYNLTARQVDRAGNTSPVTNAVTFDWDKGPLLQRLSSTTSNGIKTNTTRAFAAGDPRRKVDEIPIVLTFRKPVTITAASFTLNIKDTNTGVTTTTFMPTGITPAANASADRKTWTFTYSVGEYDSTENANLRVSAINITAKEALFTNNIWTSDGDDVSSMIDLTYVNDTTNGKEGTNLHHTKEIKIQTGFPVLVSSSITPTTTNSDGTTNATVTFKYDRDIYRGQGNINIIQVKTGYRIPAVMTESLRNRYRNIPGFDNHYEKGTNGYISTSATVGSPDTSTKYILKFAYDTYNIAPCSCVIDLSSSTSIEDQHTCTNDESRFAENFRLEERSSVSIYSSAVEVLDDTVTVTLTGSNALKVLGARYQINFPGGLIQDQIGLPNELYTTGGGGTLVAGVSQPAIRIQKPQDKIGIATTPSTSQPRFIIENASALGTALIKMDCRTPDSSVRYSTTTSEQGDTAVGWHTPLEGNGTAPPQSPSANPNQPTAPNTTTGTTVFDSTTGTISIGTAAAANGRFNGYKYRVRAAGVTGAGTAQSPYVYSSSYAEEIAFRTVIVFTGNNITGTNGQTFASGDSLWIRGGNTLTSTTIPGFPLTPQDDFALLASQKQRAGIRLMNRISTGTTALASSEWQYVTWDMIATAYFSFYLGHDNTSSAVEAFQYGPLNYAVNIGNWTTVREYYMAFPGQRRLLQSNFPDYTGSGARAIAYTFNASYTVRQVLGASITQ